MSQKYRSISDAHFDIESVSKTIDVKDVIPDGYEESMTEAEKNFFLKNGYLHARQVLAPELLDKVRAEFEQIWTADLSRFVRFNQI